MAAFIPELECLERGAHSVALKAHVGAELLAFKGHFPECAVFPGVAQIAIVQQAVAQYFASLGALQRIEQLRFQNFILPDEDVFIHLEQQDNSIQFKFSNRQQAMVASGRLIFKPLV
jgi:3-hydroxymyristoyl/3-hydroxydecanoyl-(acyl carrier protein) dehydratase